MTAPSLTPQTTMQEILDRFPGAQRALFARYHIGGCSSCGFQPQDTLEAVARSHDVADVDGMIAWILESHEEDRKLQVEPEELSGLLRSDQTPRLLDVRTEREREFALIEGSQPVTEELAREIVETWPKDTLIVLYCHQGLRSMEAVHFLRSRGFTSVRSLAGGIDAWSERVDPALPRYNLAMRP